MSINPKDLVLFVYFLYLFCLVFTNRSMYMNFITGNHNEKFGKDTVYSFLNFRKINWIKFTLLFAAKIARKSIVPLTDKSRKMF